jgi:hypothetical protein
LNPEKSLVIFYRRWLLYLFLAVCFLIAAGIRLYDLNDLPLDFHPDRQLQSMLKSRGMFAASSDYFTLEQKQIAVGQWKNQPTEEPEVLENLALVTYKMIGREDTWFPRFYSILFWLAGGVGLYLLLRDMTGTDGAVAGTLFYLFTPYGISASRAFMPDPLMLALLIWSIWGLYRWSDKPGWGRAILAGLLCGLTVYIKLTSIFFIAGIFFSLMFSTFGFKQAWRKLQFWIVGLIAILPAMLYNILGIYVFKFIGTGSIINRIIPSLLINIVSYVNWNHIISIVVSFPAFLLAIIGCFLLSNKKAKTVSIGLWAGYFIFGFIFIYYYTTHDYYQLPLILLISIGLAGLIQVLLPKIVEIIQPGWLSRPLVIALILIGIGESVWQVHNDFKNTDYSSQAQFWASLGEKLRNTSSLALTEDYNDRLSYWGWYNADYMPQMKELIHRDVSGHSGDIYATFSAVSKGKEYFLITMMDDPVMTGGLMKYLNKTYPIYDQGKGYIIFDLIKKN